MLTYLTPYGKVDRLIIPKSQYMCIYINAKVQQNYRIQKHLTS